MLAIVLTQAAAGGDKETTMKTRVMRPPAVNRRRAKKKYVARSLAITSHEHKMTYFELVRDAIVDLKDRSGSSRQVCRYEFCRQS